MKNVKSAQLDRLADASRLLGYALESNDDVDAAFRAARDAAAPTQVQALADLERLLTSDSAKGSAFTVLAWVWRESPAPQRYAKEIIAQFNRRQIFAAAAAGVVRERLASSFAYLMLVLAILCLVRFDFSLFVMPGFRQFYGGVGAQMPTLTRVVFGTAAPFFSLLLVAALAMLLFLIWYANSLRRRLQRDEPMPGWSLKVPLMGRVAAGLNGYLWMGYAAQLLAGGVEAAQAVNVAGARFAPPFSLASRTPGVALSENLQAAQHLARLAEEIRFQQSASGEQFLSILVGVQRRARMALSIFVYLLVALTVCAMYLPIFSLGSNI